MSDTQEELVDVVTKNNQVIKTIAKSLAHRDGLLHRCVIGQVVNSKGEYGFVRQASGRQDAGQFVGTTVFNRLAPRLSAR